MAGRKRSLWATLIAVAVVSVSLVYVVRSLVLGLREAEDPTALLSFDVPLFAASMLVLQLHFLLAAITWKMVLGLSGSRVPLRSAWVVHYLAQLGKYIPGKVWAVLGKVGLSTRAGVPASSASHAIILETLLILASVMLIVLPITPAVARALGLGQVISTAVVLCGVVAILMMGHPAILGRVLALASRLMRLGITWDHPDILAIVRTLPVYLAMFLMMGLAFVLLCMSFGADPGLWPGILILPTAVAIGFAFLPAPGGLGIREISLVWLIDLVTGLTGVQLPAGKAEVLSIAARLWMTLGELIAFGIALAISRAVWKKEPASRDRT
ncbi:flippase-like domain-containing protein [Candidatus Fermentibacterales bacterium]|nr:flippase-like domain-containing protein [Candidatus Fermentibacterales bacterium]